MNHVIGELHFHQAGRPVVATLTYQMNWQCPDRELEAFLNNACRVEPIESDVHRPAIHSLYQAAERLGGEVVVGRAPVASV